MSWAGIAALVALAAPVLGGKAQMQVEQIEYRSTVEDEIFHIVLSLDGTGRARLTLATNAVDPKGRPVGVFVGSVATSEITQIAEALTSPTLDEWKPAPMVPGAAFREFQMKLADGRAVERYAPSSQKAPEPFLAAEKIVQREIAALTSSPSRAALLELSAVTVHHHPERLEAELQLVNRGKEPLRLAAFDGPEPAALILDVVGGTGELPSQTFVEVKPKSVTHAPPAAQGTWNLAPGASVRIALAQKVAPLRAGKHEVQAILQTQVIDPAGGPSLQVEIRSPILPLQL